MDKLLLEPLDKLNIVVENTTSALLHDKITKTQAKHTLVSQLCMAINSFAMFDIDTYIYVYPCTQAIKSITYATNAEQVVHACLILNLMLAETIHKLNESEAD